MTFQIRNSTRVTGVDFAASSGLPWSPLASSVVLIVMHHRGKFTLTDPAPYSILIDEHGSGADSLGVLVGSGAAGTVPAFSGGSNSVDTTYWEIEDGDLGGVTAMSVPQDFFSGSTAAGPLAPSNIGDASIAIAALCGTTGDPSDGCYWNDASGWSKDHCYCFNDLGGLHPWWADYSRLFPTVGSTVSETFTNVVGQATLSGLILIPGGGGGPSGGGQRSSAGAFVG